MLQSMMFLRALSHYVSFYRQTYEGKTLLTAAVFSAEMCYWHRTEKFILNNRMLKLSSLKHKTIRILSSQ